MSFKQAHQDGSNAASTAKIDQPQGALHHAGTEGSFNFAILELQGLSTG